MGLERERNGKPLIKSGHLEKTSLAEQAYHQIRNLILDQILKPGEAVGIDAIAATLGVSQTPIREALARLEGDRLVVRLRSGRYNTAPAMSAKQYADLYDARLLLEPAAAALAAENRTDATIATLEQSLRHMIAAGTGTRSQTFVGFIDADSLFHRTIADDCANDFIGAPLKQLQANHRIGPIYRDRGVFDAPSVIREHRTIFDAIKTRNTGAAKAAMTAHIERSRRDVLGWLDQHG